jgi:hypothetical protein
VAASLGGDRGASPSNLTAFGDALITGDNSGLANLREANLRGDNGAVVQGYARIGEALSQPINDAISWLFGEPGT